jgi:hypothetical protein
MWRGRSRGRRGGRVIGSRTKPIGTQRSRASSASACVPAGSPPSSVQAPTAVSPPMSTTTCEPPATGMLRTTRTLPDCGSAVIVRSAARNASGESASPPSCAASRDAGAGRGGSGGGWARRRRAGHAPTRGALRRCARGCSTALRVGATWTSLHRSRRSSVFADPFTAPRTPKAPADLNPARRLGSRDPDSNRGHHDSGRALCGSNSEEIPAKPAIPPRRGRETCTSSAPDCCLGLGSTLGAQWRLELPRFGDMSHAGLVQRRAARPRARLTRRRCSAADQLANTRAASLSPARSRTAARAAHAAGRRLGSASSAAAAWATPSRSRPELRSRRALPASDAPLARSSPARAVRSRAGWPPLLRPQSGGARRPRRG